MNNINDNGQQINRQRNIPNKAYNEVEMKVDNLSPIPNAI